MHHVIKKGKMSPGVKHSSTADESLVTLNVGGRIFQTRASTLRNSQVGRLSRLSENDEHFSSESKQYFFDRDPEFFPEVLRMYRYGELHFPATFCSKTVRAEMAFWELPESCVGECCWRLFCKKRDRQATDLRVVRQFGQMWTQPVITERSGFKRWLWNFLENPTSSTGAKIWMATSASLLLVSIFCYALTTLPKSKLHLSWDSVAAANETNGETGRETRRFLDTVITVDLGCLAVFTLEMVLRMFSAPSKLALIKSILFVCDTLYVTSGWILDIMVLSHQRLAANSMSNWFPAMICVSTFARLFRIIRLAWYFRGIRLLLHVLAASIRELCLLGVFIFLGMMLYGFLIYAAEVNNNAKFDSAFSGFWFAIITMTTVGYGASYPVSTTGFIIAAFCAISGIVLVSMPIPIIANNFQMYNGCRERSAHQNTVNTDTPDDDFATKLPYIGTNTATGLSPSKYIKTV